MTKFEELARLQFWNEREKCFKVKEENSGLDDNNNQEKSLWNHIRKNEKQADRIYIKDMD